MQRASIPLRGGPSWRAAAARRTLAERLAILCYELIFIAGLLAITISIYICRYLPILWPVFLGYVVFLLIRGNRPALDASWPTPLKSLGLWRALQRYFNARLHTKHSLPASHGPYIFCCHPHGVFAIADGVAKQCMLAYKLTYIPMAGVCLAGWLFASTDALGFSRMFPELDLRTLTLRMNFFFPFIREFLLLHGLCDVSFKTCIGILGKGKSILIAVGGGREALYAKPGHNEVVLNKRKGFVRIALQTGASLVPVYCFGENNTFRTANELPHSSLLRRIQNKLTSLTGFTIPLFWGTGLFLPWGLLAYPVQLDVVVGEPISVPKIELDPSLPAFEALVTKYHNRYIAALKQLFDENRGKFAKRDAGLVLVE